MNDESDTKVQTLVGAINKDVATLLSTNDPKEVIKAYHRAKMNLGDLKNLRLLEIEDN